MTIAVLKRRKFWCYHGRSKQMAEDWETCHRKGICSGRRNGWVRGWGSVPKRTVPHTSQPTCGSKQGRGRGGANRASRAEAIRSCVAARCCHLGATHRQCSCWSRSGSLWTPAGAQELTPPRLLNILPAIRMTFSAQATRWSVFVLQACLVVTLPSAGTATQVSWVCTCGRCCLVPMLLCHFVKVIYIFLMCVCVCVCVVAVVVVGISFLDNHIMELFFSLCIICL